MSNPNPVLNITNNDRYKFQVRVVNTGDHYGLNDVLVNDDAPMVEFWDMMIFDEGQFVSRYYVSTILEDEEDYGLNLDGGVPEWYIDSDTMLEVADFLVNV